MDSIAGSTATHAASPSVTSASASERTSKSAGSVVSATTQSVISLIFLLYWGRKPGTNLPSMATAGETAQDSPARTPGRRLPRTRQDIQNRRRQVLTYAILLCSTILMVNALVGE